MKRAITCGLAALAVVVLTVGTPRADTCYYIPGVQNTDCSRPPQVGNPAQAGAQPGETSGLREILRRSLQTRSPNASAATQKDAILNRLQAASRRMDSAIQAAAQSRDPGELQRLRLEYSGALQDFRRAMGELIAATSDAGQRGHLENLWRQQEEQANQQATQAGLFSPPSPVAAAPTAQTPPDRFEACGEADRRGIQTCYDAPRFGNSCRITHRQGGEIIWSAEQQTCDGRVLEQRNAFFNKHPGPNPAPAARFTMDAGETDAEVRRLTADPSEQFLRQLPLECARLLQGFMIDTYSARNPSAGTRETRQQDAQAATQTYGRLDASPECRDAMKRIADRNRLDLPVRHLSARARNVFENAMAIDPSRPTLLQSPGTELEDTGYDASEVLDFGIALLNIAGGFAGVAGAMHHGGASLGSITHTMPSGGIREAPFVAPRTNASTITGLGSH